LKGKIKVFYKKEKGSLLNGIAIKLKLEDEWFYWHERILVFDDWDDFEAIAIMQLSNIENIKNSGEYFMKEILKSKIEQAKYQSDEKTINKLLKELSKPIQIEIKEK